MSAVSYTHLDVYKRQGHTPGDLMLSICYSYYIIIMLFIIVLLCIIIMLLCVIEFFGIIILLLCNVNHYVLCILIQSYYVSLYQLGMSIILLCIIEFFGVNILKFLTNPFFYLFVCCGVVSVSYTHLDVYKRQKYPVDLFSPVEKQTRCLIIGQHRVTTCT